MITPYEIRRKAERWYLPFLQSWVCGEAEAFFPRDMSAGATPEDFVAMRDAIEALQRGAKRRGGYGYEIVFQLKRLRRLGDQHVPMRIVLATPRDLLALIDKEQEFEQFQHDVAFIRTHLPQLGEWMARVPQRVIEHHGAWPDLVAVCTYFLEHPRPDLYVRELPIAVHTKFIEQHRGTLQELLALLLPGDALRLDAPTFEQRVGLREEESLIRVRLLDEQLLTRHGLPLSDLSLPCSQFARLELQGQHCIICENKMTFLTLPQFRRTFALFGKGFMVSQLATVPWLAECPIVYWGDLDAQGFQILSALRSVFRHVTSVMMDEQTLQAFSSFCVPGTSCTMRELPYLSEAEQLLCRYLIQHNVRLEQEHIDHAYAVKQLAAHLF
jgi:hypothetical protein